MLNSSAWHVNQDLRHTQTYRMHSGAKARKKNDDSEDGGKVKERMV